MLTYMVAAILGGISGLLFWAHAGARNGHSVLAVLRVLIARVGWGALSAVFVLAALAVLGEPLIWPHEVVFASIAAGLGMPGVHLLAQRLGLPVPSLPDDARHRASSRDTGGDT